MLKHKHKASKLKLSSKTRFKPQTPLRRGLLAGAVFAVIMAPLSWYAVNAQSADPALDGAGTSIGGRSDEAAAKVGRVNGQSQSVKSTHTSANKSADSKKATSTSESKSNAKNSSKPAATPSPVATPSTVPAPVPSPAPAISPAGWHDNIITTIFWIGEAADASNAHISNAESAWDGNWQSHFGGFDDPDHRNGFNPAGFTPLENPFYFALPYNDLDANGNRKPSANNCPNTGNSISWCKNAWIKITKGNKTAYAQWQDVGPLEEDDSAYVFGSAKSKNTWGAKAGLDVSPAVRDYLGLQDVDKTGWSFVSAGSVPSGPWKAIVTTSQGGW